MNLQVEYVSIDEIFPYANNAKIHTDEQIDEIANSINEFGMIDPIGIWKNNEIIEGHGRLLACKKLGIKTVPIIRLDELTDEQRKAYALAHNKLTMNTDFDFSILDEELASLEDIDMSLFGFEKMEIEEPKPIVEDEFSEDVPPRTEKGQIWILGDHRLMCGDSTNADDVEKLMNGNHAELLLTDPPYGICAVKGSKVGGGGELHFKGKVHGNAKNAFCDAKEYRPIIGDDTTETAHKNYEIALTCTENQIIFGGNYFTDFLPPSRCWIVWDKQNSGSFADAELAYTSFDKVVKLYHFLWNGLCRAGSREVEGKTRVHPTQKPVGMIAEILRDFSNENDSILDCFGGSGSTLIACEQTNRKCFMMELDPHYCDVIIKRWEDFTGKKAVLLDDEAK